jgi:hypothetical protein
MDKDLKEFEDQLRASGCSEEDIKFIRENQQSYDKEVKEDLVRIDELRAHGLLPTVPDPIYSKDPFEGQPEKQKARDEYYRKLFSGNDIDNTEV